MRARLAASAVVVALLLVGTTGCTFMTPQATTQGYDASDGIGTTLGDLRINNALLVSADGQAANLIVSIHNPTAVRVKVSVQYENGDGTKVDESIFVKPESTKSLGTTAEGPLQFNGIGTPAGDLLPVFFQYDDVTGQSLLVPVLAPEGAYASLAPAAGS